MELYPNIGYYQEAIRYTDPSAVPRSQTVGLHDGQVQFRFKFLSDKRETLEVRGVQRKVFVKVLETKSDLPFKVNDVIYIGSENYRISFIDKHLPKDKEGIVRRWPQSLQKYQVTRLTL